MKHCLAAGLILLVVCSGARAMAMPGLSQLYETYVWNAYPDIDLLQQSDAQRMKFPDSQSAPALSVEYGEIEYFGHGTLGVLMCTSKRDGHVSVIHYSADGLSRIFHRQLPLYAQQQVTLAGALPSGVAGVTLLLVWQETPDHDSLVALARNPNTIEQPIAGVSESYWFERRSANLYLDPWRDIFRPPSAVPALYAEAGWPWCSARLTSHSQVVAKDCAVDFSGLTEWGMDDYGTFGRWRLDWSSELTLICELPVSESWMSAELLIYSGESLFAPAVDLSELELTINGWPVSPRYSQEFDGFEAQPIALSLSQYLHGGSNRITLGVSSLASREWLIDGIELWVY